MADTCYVDQDQRELSPAEVLQSTAERLTKYRIETLDLVGNCILQREYLEKREEELKLLYRNDIARLSLNQEIRLGNVIGESIFWLMCIEAQIPLAPGTGNQACKGQDFFLNDQPIDTTTSSNFANIKGKMRNDATFVVGIPIILYGINNKEEVAQKTCLDLFLNQELTYQEYFLALIYLNRQFKQRLISEGCSDLCKKYKNLSVLKPLFSKILRFKETYYRTIR